MNCSVLTPHVKELGKKLNIGNETLLRGLFTVWKNQNPTKLDNEVTEVDIKNLLNQNSQIDEKVINKFESSEQLLDTLASLPEVKSLTKILPENAENVLDFLKNLKVENPYIKELLSTLVDNFSNFSFEYSDSTEGVLDFVTTLDNGSKLLINKNRVAAFLFAHGDKNVDDNIARIFAHEYIHSFTANVVKGHASMVQLLGGRKEDIAFNKDIKNLYDYTIKELQKRNTALSSYGLTNEVEFVAELMTNDEFQKLLTTIPYESSKESILDRFVNLVKNLFNSLFGKNISNTVLNEGIKAVTDYMNFTIENGKYQYVISDSFVDNTIYSFKDMSIVSTDILSVNENTPRAKLNREIDPITQQKRIKLIADRFYALCDTAIEEKKEELRAQGEYKTILDWENSVYGRMRAIKTLDVDEILDKLQTEFMELADVGTEYELLWNNFTPLLEDACKLIERDSGIRLILSTKNNKVVNGFVSDAINDENNPNLQDNTEGEATETNDLCTYKARHTDPHATISLTTKSLLRQIVKVDHNGDDVVDDLGFEEYLDEEYAHAILVEELSALLGSDDFAIIDHSAPIDDEDRVRLPMLEKIAVKYPWVNQLIDKLKENPDNIAAFYHDFRNNFISYYMYSEMDGVIKPMNQSNAIGSTLAQVKRDYEQGNTLTDNSIYDSSSNLNMDNIETVEGNLQEVQTLIESYEDGEFSEDEMPEYTEGVTTLLTNIVKSIGINASPTAIEALVTVEENKEALDACLMAITAILAESKKLTDSKTVNLITYLNSYYKTLAQHIGAVSELENMGSFRQGDKTYYSYSAPNMADTQVLKLKSDNAIEYIENEFGYDEFYKKDGKWRNYWLQRLTDADGIFLRNKISTMDLKTIDSFGNKKQYEDWTSQDIDKAFITAYYSAGKDMGYYHYPIFSDSPVAKFIKMIRFSGKDYKAQILPLLREVVLQEVDRITKVQKREEEGVQKIANYDGKRGKEFCFFPQLNKVNEKTGNTYLTDIRDLKNESEKNAYIEAALSEIMEVNFRKFLLTTEQLTPQDLEKLGVNLTPAEALEEYYWNSVFAETQIIQLTTGDLAFYKNAVDFQKRYKQVYAAGKRLFTNSKYGRKFENVIYLKDSISTYDRISALKLSLENAVKAGRITQMDVDNILDKFKDVNATDAQGFRTLNSYRSILDMMGQWTPVMEEAVNAVKKGEWDMSHFNIIWQTVKPFLYGATVKPDGLGGKMRVMHQNKDSEFLLLATLDLFTADAKSPMIKALTEFMEENNIDMALYESGCKVGNQGPIDLNYYQDRIDAIAAAGKVELKSGRTINITSNSEGIITIKEIKTTLDNLLENGNLNSAEYNEVFDYLTPSPEEIKKILKDSIITNEAQDAEFNRGERPNKESYFVPTAVHTFSFEDYMIAQPTPEHLIDTETIFGSQFRNLIIADLPTDFKVTINGKSYNREEIINLYNEAIIENLLDSFEVLKNEFKDIHTVQQKLKSMIEGNPKFEKDILQALEIVTITDPNIGKQIETFNIPLNNPSTTEKLQELLLSAFKNRLTKQKINGGNAILVSSVGYTDKLHRVVDGNGTLIGYECMLPATSKEWFEPLLVEKDGYQVLDINKLDDDLKELIGYRIPTEHKYSMVPLIIKGFLPQQNGSSIMVAKEITTASGCDYDVDKMFLMMYNFYKGKDGKLHKSKPKNPNSPLSEWSKEERDNLIIDISKAILTHPSMGWINSRPGNYDTLKIESRKAQILESPQMLNQFMSDYQVKTAKELKSKLNELSLDELNNFLKTYTTEINPLELTTFKYFHKQNMTGSALIGIYANNTTMQAKFQESALRLDDASAITINGITYTSLSEIYSQDGKLISFNCSETSAASVDNAKDPVLADLMQNTDTAKVLCLLLRLGVPIEDACALFNVPAIRRIIKSGIPVNRVGSSIIDKYASVYDALAKKFGGIRLDPNRYVLKHSRRKSNINTEEILETIIYYNTNEQLIRSILNSPLDKIEINPNDAMVLMEYLDKTITYASVFSHIEECAEELKVLTKVSRADSPNGAIAHNIEEAVIQKRRVDLMHSTNIKHLKGLETTLKNDVVNIRQSRKAMKQTFMDSKVPRLQAFHTLGIELPLQMVSKYFVQTNPWMSDKTKFVFDNAPGGVITSHILKKFYNGLVYYVLSNSKIFGNDGNLSFEDKRNWYLYSFPQKFIKLLNQYPQLRDNVFINKLTIKSGKIFMERAGKLTPIQRQSLNRMVSSLLYSDLNNPELTSIKQQLAVDLMMYSFYTTGLAYGPDNYGMFFDTTFYNSFPEFIKTLREIPHLVNDAHSELLKNFMDQFYAIWGKNCTYTRTLDSKQVINGFPQTIGFEKKLVKNPLLKDDSVLEYITAQYTSTEQVNTGRKDANGNDIIIPQQVRHTQLYKKSGSTNEEVYYTIVGELNDPFTGTLRYNANKTASELVEDANSAETKERAENQTKVKITKDFNTDSISEAKPNALDKYGDKLNDVDLEAITSGPANIENMPDFEDAPFFDELGIPADIDSTLPVIPNEEAYDAIPWDTLEPTFEGINSIADQLDYMPEEGNEELEEPLCKAPKKN